jgi:uncharacterized protein
VRDPGLGLCRVNVGVIGVDHARDEQRARWTVAGNEDRGAEPPAHPDGQVWLRLWSRTLVLAFLVARPLPQVPAAAAEGWLALGSRSRECLLTTIIGDAVTPRAPALRASYDPGRLTSVITAVAGRMLDRAASVPFRAGHVWVIPQLRWLHEVERAHPLGQERIRLEDFAAPLEFGLAGLPDWPGIKIGDRLGALRRHPLSMTAEHNRQSATIALLGGEPGAGLDADLAMAGTELGPRQRLRHAARMMGIGGRRTDPGWLEVVLSWPHRIIGSAAE